MQLYYKGIYDILWNLHYDDGAENGQHPNYNTEYSYIESLV